MINLKEKYKNDPEYREKRKAFSKAYQAKNKNKVNAAKRKYYATEKGKANILAAQRRYRGKLLSRAIVVDSNIDGNASRATAAILPSTDQHPGDSSPVQDTHD
jgi:hypothetical protein